MTKGIRENIFIALKIGDENDTILLPLQYISSKRWKIRFKVEKGKCKMLTNMFSIIAIGWSSNSSIRLGGRQKAFIYRC